MNTHTIPLRPSSNDAPLHESKQVGYSQEFLQHLARLEGAPLTTHYERLCAAGLVLPDPADFTNTEISAVLYVLIRELAEIGVYLEHTNHLNNRELYEHLMGSVLRTPIRDMPEVSTMLSMVSGRSEEGVNTWLAFHASEDDREIWAEVVGPIPPRQPPRSMRDMHLPRPHLH